MIDAEESAWKGDHKCLGEFLRAEEIQRQRGWWAQCSPDRSRWRVYWDQRDFQPNALMAWTMCHTADSPTRAIIEAEEWYVTTKTP